MKSMTTRSGYGFTDWDCGWESESDSDSDYEVNPEAVKLAVTLHQSIHGNEVDEIRNQYETLRRGTLELARVEDVFELVNRDYMFCSLYLEIWYRRHFGTSDVSPSLEQRIDIWANYCFLFQHVFRGPVHMSLPHEWLWDMVDEFVNQFQSFSEFRALGPKTEQDAALLKIRHEAWSVLRACSILKGLIEDSSISQHLEQATDGGLQLLTTTTDDDDDDDSGSSNLSKKVLAYFCMVALSRIHCLLGDYQNGLDCLLSIDISRPGFYRTLVAVHVTIIYHYGFANLMLAKYADAIHAFSNTLECVFHTKQDEQTLHKIEQMYALLAICLSLCPPQLLPPINNNVNSFLKEKYGEKMSIMQRRNDAAAVALYGELLSFAWPAFSRPFAPNSGDPREIMEEDDYARYDAKDLAIAYPKFFGPSAPKYEGPLVNHNRLEAVIPNMLRSKQK